MAKKGKQSQNPVALAGGESADQALALVPTLEQLAGLTLPTDGIVALVHRSLLNPAPYNPRVIDEYSADGLLQNVRRTEGLVEKIVWNRFTGHLVSGHQRINAEDKRRGTKDYFVQANVVHWESLAFEQEQNIALNNRAIQGDYDIERLDELLRRPEVNLENTGFDPVSLEDLYISAGRSFSLEEILNSTPPDEINVSEGVVESVAAADEINEQLAEADAAIQREKGQKQIQAIKDRRQEMKRENEFKHDMGIARTIVFTSSELAEAFMRFLGLSEVQEKIDGIGMVKRLELDIPEFHKFMGGDGRTQGSTSGKAATTPPNVKPAQQAKPSQPAKPAEPPIPVLLADKQYDI